MKKYIIMIFAAAMSVIAVSCKKEVDPSVSLVLSYEGKTCSETMNIPGFQTYTMTIDYEFKSLVPTEVDAKGTKSVHVGIPTASEQDPNKGTILVSVVPKDADGEDCLTVIAHNEKFSKEVKLYFKYDCADAKTLSFVSNASVVKLPQISGTGFEGAVYWTESSDCVMWQSGLSKNYGNTSAHTVKILTLNAENFTFSTLSNVQKISVSVE